MTEALGRALLALLVVTTGVAGCLGEDPVPDGLPSEDGSEDGCAEKEGPEAAWSTHVSQLGGQVRDLTPGDGSTVDVWLEGGDLVDVALWSLSPGSGETERSLPWRMPGDLGVEIARMGSTGPVVAASSEGIRHDVDVAALDTGPNETLWEKTGGQGSKDAASLAPVPSRGTIVVGMEDTRRDETRAVLDAIHAETGDERWTESFHVGPAIGGTPIVRVDPTGTSGVVFTPPLDGEEATVIGFDAQTGDERWSTSLQLPSGPEIGPVFSPDGQTVFLAASDPFTESEVLALSMEDGEARWTRTLSGSLTPYLGTQVSYPGPDEGLAVADGKLLVHTKGKDAGLLALDQATGDTVWRTEQGECPELYGSGEIEVGPEGTVYVPYFLGDHPDHVLINDRTRLAAYDLADGDLRWSTIERGSGATELGNLEVADGTLVAGGLVATSEDDKHPLVVGYETPSAGEG